MLYLSPDEGTNVQIWQVYQRKRNEATASHTKISNGGETQRTAEPGVRLNLCSIGGTEKKVTQHDDVIKWKHFPRHWPFVWGIHRSLVNSPYKGQWRGALMFSLICACINAPINNREAGDLRRHRAHYDVIVMKYPYQKLPAGLKENHGYVYGNRYYKDDIYVYAQQHKARN